MEGASGARGPGVSGRRSEPPKGNVGGPGRGDPLGLCPPCPTRRGADQSAVRAASGAAFVRNSESPQDGEVVGAAGGSPARLPPPPKLRGPAASLWFAAPPPLTFAPLRTPRSPSAPRSRRSPLRPPTPLPRFLVLFSPLLRSLPPPPPSSFSSSSSPLPPPPPVSALSPSPAPWSAVPTPSPRAGDASPEEPQFPRPRRPGSQCPRIRPQRPLLGCPGGPALLRGFSCAQSEPGGRGSREGPRGSRRSRGSERVSAPGASFVSNPRDRVRGCAKRLSGCVAWGLTPRVPPRASPCHGLHSRNPRSCAPRLQVPRCLQSSLQASCVRKRLGFGVFGTFCEGGCVSGADCDLVL